MQATVVPRFGFCQHYKPIVTYSVLCLSVFCSAVAVAVLQMVFASVNLSESFAEALPAVEQQILNILQSATPQCSDAASSGSTSAEHSTNSE